MPTHEENEATAIAVSSALVGEMIVDSPSGPRQVRRPVKKSGTTGTAGVNRHSFSPERLEAMMITGDSATGTTTTQQHHQQQQQYPSQPTDKYYSTTDDSQIDTTDDDASSASWMDRGTWSSWWNERKERQQREYLQRLAFQQKQKLVHHQQQYNNDNSHQHNALQDNATFRQLSSQRDHASRDAILDSRSRSSSYDDDVVGEEEAIAASKSGVGVSVQLDPDAIQQPKQDDADFWIPEAKIQPETPQKDEEGATADEEEEVYPYLLSQPQRQVLCSNGLPPSLSYCTWKRLYSLTRDGDSFESFLRLTSGYPHSLLVIQTTKGDVLGAYADSEWKATHQGNPEFYGSAQAFLFSVKSTTSLDNNNMDSTLSNNTNNNVQIYKWTGANRYIQFVDSKSSMLAFGGGGGNFGLCVERDFTKGSSGPCATFGNAPLATEENFNVLNVECYSFLTGTF